MIMELFIRVKIGDDIDIPVETRCSECFREGKLKVYQGEIRRSNVIRHCRKVHNVVLVVPQVKHHAVIFKHVHL